MTSSGIALQQWLIGLGFVGVVSVLASCDQHLRSQDFGMLMSDDSTGHFGHCFQDRGDAVGVGDQAPNGISPAALVAALHGSAVSLDVLTRDDARSWVTQATDVLEVEVADWSFYQPGVEVDPNDLTADTRNVDCLVGLHTQVRWRLLAADGFATDWGSGVAFSPAGGGAYLSTTLAELPNPPAVFVDKGDSMPCGPDPIETKQVLLSLFNPYAANDMSSPVFEPGVIEGGIEIVRGQIVHETGRCYASPFAIEGAHAP